MIVMIIGVVIVNLNYFEPTRAAIRQAPWFIIAGALLITTASGYRAFRIADEVHKLGKAVPIERIDFRYIASRNNRELAYVTIIVVLCLLPTLYGLGLVNRMAKVAGDYISSNHAVANGLAWLATAAVSGIVGNVATALLARAFWPFIKPGQRRKKAG